MRRTANEAKVAAPHDAIADPWHGHEKIIVCGSKSFSDYDLLNEWMDRLTRKFCRVVVLSGVTAGADAMGEKWAFSWWWSVLRFHPDYQTHGKRAPLIRNTEMVNAATRCVVFNNESADDVLTDLIDKAKRKGIPTKVIKF